MVDPAGGVSSHYLVTLDGRTIQLVDECDAARHAGRVRSPSASLVLAEGGDPNLYTVGIELEDGGDPSGVRRPDEQYVAAASLISRIAARWSFALDREHVIGHREVFAPKDCPGNVDLDRLIREASAAPPARGMARVSQTVACLTPARNAENELEELLASAARFADLVIALDDGSTDSTASVLEASPLVAQLIENPRRATHSGWDDARNRQRLLEAAIERGVGWVVYLDADERIDPDDAAALRDFLLADALPGLAYGLRLHRMWGDDVLTEPRVVYRAFQTAPGLVIGGERLHFNPVPGGLGAERLLRTTIRVRHLDSEERLAERRRKYREADPGGRFEAAGGAMLTRPEGQFVKWWRRPSALAVLDTGSGEGLERMGGGGRRLACLLPARNVETEIEDYLESVAAFADLVVALDDGSTDGTATLLAGSPLVARVLRNPRRDTYGGWDDRANRQALLDAAVQEGADWAIFLDADERIDPQEAAALRRFVDEEADPGCAYGFRVHRMIGDREHFDASGLWAFRLYAAVAGAQLPGGRLHAVPVPRSIPAACWLRTSLRIQHLASMTPERRSARLSKYEEADPQRRWQRDYSNLVEEPGALREWVPRASDVDVLLDREHVRDRQLAVHDRDAPVLSAIVIAGDDEKTIEASVRSVVEQECPEPFEVIVVVSGSPGTASVVRDRFPDLHLVELAERVLPGAARNAGLERARGEYVSFPGSHVALRPGSLAARLAAHDRGFTMVTGSILNGTRTRSGWASYFLDHSSALPGRPSGELAGAPAHCSYVRSALEEVGGFRADLRAGEDTAVNQELHRRGHGAFREQSIELVHFSRCSSPWRLASHHFVRGRSMTRVFLLERGSRRALPRFLAGYSRRRLVDTEARVRRWGSELWPEYRRARLLVAIGVAAASAGAAFEALRPRRGGAGRRAAT